MKVDIKTIDTEKLRRTMSATTGTIQVGGKSFDQREKIKQSKAWASSKFVDEDVELSFYQIIKKPAETLKRFLKISSSDLQVEHNIELLSYILQQADYSFKENVFTRDKRKLLESQYVDIGSVFTRTIIKGNLFDVWDAENTIFDPVNINNGVVAHRSSININTILNNPEYDATEIRAMINNESLYNEADLYETIDRTVVDGEVKWVRYLSVEIPHEYSALSLQKDAVWQPAELFVIWNEVLDYNPIRHIAREPIYGRTLGKSMYEEYEEEQMQANEAHNYAMEGLREASSPRWTTDDPDFDGSSMSDFDKNSILQLSKGTQVNQFQYNPVGYGYATEGRAVAENKVISTAGASNSVTGVTEKYVTSSASSQARIDSQEQYNRAKEDVMLFVEMLYKELFLDMLLGYIDDEHKITNILSVSKLGKFYNSIAKLHIKLYNIKAIKEGNDLIEFDEEIIRNIASELKGTPIKFKNSFGIKKEDVKDGFRVVILDEKNDAIARINSLNTLIMLKQNNPNSLPDHSVEGLSAELAKEVAKGEYIESAVLASRSTLQTKTKQ